MESRALIEIDQLSKSFQVRRSSGRGLLAGLAGFFASQVDTVPAVREISFSIARGERVAFIGPNGAGKSTTIKMLSGILHPDSGHAEVLGMVPWRDRTRLAYRAGTVFGQRSQLWYDLPPRDTFALLAHVYELGAAEFRGRMQELTTAFALEPLLEKPVCKLSLGERMRCEIAASLLHRPSILFLDEPTIGLDVTAKAVIRDLLRQRSERDGATLLLTSHDTGDVEQVCDRAIVIHGGRILLDAPISALRRTLSCKRITFSTEMAQLELAIPGLSLLAAEPHRTTFELDTSATQVEVVVGAALQQTGIRDLSIEDPPLERVIRALYEREEAKKS